MTSLLPILLSCAGDVVDSCPSFAMTLLHDSELVSAGGKRFALLSPSLSSLALQLVAGID